MLAHKELLRIARRYDTLMSHAMMRALGYQGAPGNHRRRRKRGGGEREAAERAKYAGVRRCFRNIVSPLDWKRAR